MEHNNAQNAVISRYFDEFVELNCGRNFVQRKYEVRKARGEREERETRAEGTRKR